MAVADVAAPDKHAISTFLKSPQHMMRGDAAGAHYPDYPDIGRILQAADARQVGTRVSAPVAEEPDNFRFKFLFSHVSTPFRIQA